MIDSRPPIKERIEGNRSILKFKYLILLIAGSILIESCILANRIIQTTSVSQANPTIQTTPTSQAKPTLERTSCGVGEYNTHAAIWVEGQKAKQGCDQVMLMIRQQGKQPYAWDGQISSALANHWPVCSDALPGLSYEVIDTDDGWYGTEWCVWMVKTFGGSSSPTTPDLFNIITQAQELQQTRESIERYREAQRITQAAATYQAEQQIYANACQQHHGYLDNGYCVVDYPGWSAQKVAIHSDGTWDEERAEIERKTCETQDRSAAIAEQDGWPWSNPPLYHEDTGVCARGNP